MVSCNEFSAMKCKKYRASLKSQGGEAARRLLPLSPFLSGDMPSRMTEQKEGVLIAKSPHGRKAPTKQECQFGL